MVLLTGSPSFGAPIANVTAAVGREAILTCLVGGLGIFKVSRLISFIYKSISRAYRQNFSVRSNARH